MSARATHLKAATGIVLVTTIERKQMSNKTTFKRISLALVGALGVGVLAAGPSSSAVVDETLTISASSGTVVAGETLSVTVTSTFIGDGSDTSNIVVTNTLAAANARFRIQSDSAGASNLNSLAGDASQTVGNITCANGTYCKVTLRLDFAPTLSTAASSNSVFTISSRTGASGAVRKAVTFTLAVTASTQTTATAAASKMWLNKDQAADSSQRIEADSALVVTAGAAATPTKVGFLHFILNNSSDTKTNVTPGTVTLVISGPGLLGDSATTNTAGSGVSGKVKQLTVPSGDTVSVFSDGTQGVGTITAYLGSSVSTAAKFAQTAKSVTFSGAAATITAALETTSTLAMNADAVNVVSFTAKDAGGNLLTSAALNTYAGFWAVSSDTKIIGTNSSAATSCSAPATGTTWYCTLPMRDSGTATITIADSTVVTAAAVQSAALTLTVAGAAYTGTLAFDKATYRPGEQMILTITGKDRNGKNVVDGARDVFSSEEWSKGNTPTFGSGGAFTTDLPAYLATASFAGGIDTAVAVAPSVAGTWTLTAVTSGTGADSKTVTLNFTVTDPAEEAANSALDAAQEATDAAIAATDAAVLAQESADAAAVAAEAAAETAAEAAEAAKAAVDAVTKLSAEVTKLLTQLATLQKLMNRIAKKVGVKV